MKILAKQSLAQLNTFKVEASAEAFYEFSTPQELQENWPLLAKYEKRLVLGGGSNVLFVADFPGLIIFPQLFGITSLEENSDFIRLRVGASENWHQFVLTMTERGYFGLENLALIPGTVGASPVQNIGAYGVEVKSLIERVECFDLNSGKIKSFDNEQCQFAYRDSHFKRAGQGHYVVLSVDFKLSKSPKLTLTYMPLAEVFAEHTDVSPMAVLEKVCEIRRSKLPDPLELPNAGSFFKNPIVSQEKYQSLKKQFSKLVAFESGDKVKLAAGWLIDNAGLRGIKRGKVGTHIHQALVLVNYGEIDGEKIWALAREVQAKVFELYGVELEPEVRVEGRDV